MKSLSQIKEGEINYELTKQAKSNPKYKLFMEWAIQNGLKFTKVDFPVAFGPSGVIGMAAVEDIPCLCSFIAIPNRLIITPKKIRASPIGKMINMHPEHFKDHTDAEFNTLAAFLLYEKLKGEKSFFFPFLNAISDCCTISRWAENELAELDDPYLKLEAEGFNKDLENSWRELEAIIKKFPEHFPLERLSQKLYCETYETVMTRCFGWTLPATMMVPFADFLNHSDRGTTHYIVNTRFEENEDKLNVKYMIKKRKTDLSFLNKKLALTEEDKEIFLVPSGIGLEYCKRHREYLTEENYRIIMNENERPDYYTVKRIITQLNTEILKRDKDRHIWQVNFYNESDQEDNDTEEENKDDDDDGETDEDDEDDDDDDDEDSEDDEEEDDEEDEEEEEIIIRSKGTKCKNVEKKRNEISMKKPKNEKNMGVDKQKKIGCNINNQKQEEEEDEDDIESSSDEETRKERNKYRYEKGIINEDFSLQKYLKHNINEIEKLQMRKLSIKEEKDIDEEDDTDWTWLKLNMAFIFKKQYNLRVNRKAVSKDLNPQKILFKNYANENNAKKQKDSELTREFRVKSSRLCENVIAYLRAHLLANYKGDDIAKIVVTMPTSLDYETYILDYVISLFTEVKNQYKTTIQQDEDLLKDPKLNIRKRFATLLRLGNKEIAEEQIKLAKIILFIIKGLRSGLDLKTAYMKKHNEYDKTNEDVYLSRKKISHYLRLLNDHYK